MWWTEKSQDIGPDELLETGILVGICSQVYDCIGTFERGPRTLGIEQIEASRLFKSIIAKLFISHSQA